MRPPPLKPSKLAHWVGTMLLLTLANGYMSQPLVAASPQRTSPAPERSVSPFSSPRPTHNIIAQQRSCTRPNRSEYIYGTYKVGWTVQGNYYESVLEMRGDSGLMLTSYFNPNINRPELVLQTMRIQSCSFGLVIAGYSPRDPETKLPKRTYSADNLVMRRQPNGEIIIVNCDDAEVCAPATIESVDNR